MKTSKIYCLCYRSQWPPGTCNNKYRMDFKWFVRHL